MAFLEGEAAQDRPAHAYLFCGPDGVGKKIVAVWFACLLNCPHPLEDTGRSCSVCTRIAETKHPDVIIEIPTKGSIKIERVRELRNFFRYAPVEGRFRVVIIDDAHLMNRSAQNALLKTLEEPPPARILILVSSNPSLLLPTVRSRCRKVRFSPLSKDSLMELLQKIGGLSHQEAIKTVPMAQGSIRKGLEIASSRYLNLCHEFISFLNSPRELGIKGLLELSAKLSGDKRVALYAIEFASLWIRDMLLIKAECHSVTIMDKDLLDIPRTEAQHHCSSRELLEAYEELAKASQLVGSEINVNCNLITDRLLLKLTAILGGPN